MLEARRESDVARTSHAATQQEHPAGALDRPGGELDGLYLGRWSSDRRRLRADEALGERQQRDGDEVIAGAYKHEHLLIDPIVRVTPAEYHSYLVRVTGAVTRPYEFQAVERLTLVQVLATAGGPAPNSNGQIEVIRRDPATGMETKDVIPIKALLEEDDPKYNIVLKGGEEVHLPEALRVTQ